MKHSVVAPSAAHIWGKPEGCTGYVKMIQNINDIYSIVEAEVGTASHEIASTVLHEYLLQQRSTLDVNSFLGKIHENGVMYNEEMYEAAMLYVDDVINVAKMMTPHYLFIEQKIDCNLIHTESYGHVDACYITEDNRDLYVWDYKYGHCSVEVFENWQLINYTAGIAIKHNLLDDTRIHLRVVQPRAYHRDGIVREWIIKLEDLRGYFNILSRNAHVSLSDDAVLNTGSHCKNCHARHQCEPALKSGMSLYETSMNPVPLEMSNAAMSTQLNIITRAKEQLDALHVGYSEMIKGLIQSGESIKNWNLEQGMSPRKWNKSIKEIIVMGECVGVDLKKPDDVITPTQSLKLNITNDIVELYSQKYPSSLKLVQDDGSKARQIFSQK